MKRQLNTLLTPAEWLAVAVWVLLALGIYATLLSPSLRTAAGRDEIAERKTAAVNELLRTRQSLEAIQGQIEADREELERLGGAPPTQERKDLIIARLAAMADAAGLAVEQYTPIDTIEETDHLAFYVQFSAHGTFPGIRDYFRSVETEIDFVDVTHFTITATPRGRDGGCLIQWSCRVNVLRPDVAPSSAVTARGPRDQPIAEVVRHED